MGVTQSKVELEFTAGTWTDVTDYWDGSRAVTVTAGRADTIEAVQPGRMTGLVLDNTDGRFTAGNTSGAYWPNVLSGKRVRVSVQNPVSLTYVPRFTGRVDGWPLSWEDNGSTCLVTLSATDMLGDWAQASMSYGDSWMYTRLSELAGANLIDYWGCTWLNESGNLPNSKGRGALVGNGSAPLTLSGVGLPGDPRQTPEHVYGAGFFTAAISPTSSKSWTVTAWIRVTADPPSTGFYPIIVERIVALPPGDRVAMRVKGDSVWLSTISAGGIVTDRLSATVDVVDGSWHCVRMGITESAGTVTASLYVDNVGGATTTGMTVANSLADATWDRFIKVGSSFTGSVAHVAYFDGGTALTNQQIASPGLGFYFTPAGTRLTAIADYAGLTAPTVLGSERAPLAASTPFGKPLDLVSTIEATEGGLLWCDGAGVVTFNCASERTSTPTLAFTLDVSEVGKDLNVAADNVTVVNEVTVTNTQPVSAFKVDPTTTTVTVRDSQSVTSIGPRSRSLSVSWYNSNNPGYLRTRAEELLSRNPAPRIPTLSIEPLTMSDAQQAAALSADVWNLISILNLPSAGGWVANWLGRIEGWTEVLSIDQWDMTFNMSFAGTRVGSPTYGVLGTTQLG